MALCLKYFYCFSVFLSVFLPGIVSDEIDAVYKFLSWKLDDVLTETKHLKIKVDNIDARVKNVEEKLQGLQTTTPNPIDLRIEEQRRELETELKDSLEMQELAVQKMLSKEKMLLRESMKNFTIVFAELKSEIQTQMSVFNASFKEEVKSIGTEFDNLKSEIRLERMEYNKTLSEDISAIKETVEINLKDMYEIGNNNSMVLMKGIAELTSDWNSTTHNISQILQTMEKTMVSKIEEIENRMIANVKKKQRETQQSISKVQADVHSLSTNISTFSSVLSNRISSESSSLSFNLSSLSSSLSSQMSSHANRIYLLEERPSTSSLVDSGTFKLNVTHLKEYGKIRWMTYGNSSIIPQDDYGCLLVKMGGKYLVVSRFTFNLPADFNTTTIWHYFTLLDNVGKNKEGGFRRIYVDAKKGQRSPSVVIEVFELAPEEQICVNLTRPDLLYISWMDNAVNLVKV